MALRIEFACFHIVSHWINTYLITQSFAAGAFAAAAAASAAAAAAAAAFAAGLWVFSSMLNKSKNL